jgi:hypothetical protein
MGPETALEPGAVGALHNEDDVGPFHQFSGAGLLRIGSQAGGGGLDAGPGREDLLGRGRAEAVAGAEEKEVGQGRIAYLPITLFQSTT